MKRVISAAACLLILLFSALLLNCSEESSPTGPGRVHVIMPLEEGNVWNYADTVAIPNSLTFGSSLTVTGDTVVTYEDMEYSIFSVEHFETLNGITSKYFMRNDEYGLWEFGTACDLDTRYYKMMLAKYPTDVGSDWMKDYFYCNTNNYVEGFPSGPAECIAVDSLYTTLAGTFECSVYLSVHEVLIIGTTHIYTFYAVDIGMVAREIRSDIFYWKTSLIDYDLK